MERHAVFLESPATDPVQLAAEIAGLLGASAASLRPLLARPGSQLSRPLAPVEAAALAHSLSLLGLRVMVRPCASTPAWRASPGGARPAPRDPERPRPDGPRPDGRRLWFWLVVVGLLVLVPAWLTLGRGAEASPPPGVLVSMSPKQTAAGGVRPWEFREHVVIPLARYDVSARVLARKRYPFGREGRISPLDVALGWGPMSDSRVLEEVRVSQRGRWYYLSWNTPPLSVADMIANSANTHLIPATPALAREIARIRPGQVVRLQGYLVEVFGEDGFSWRSSLSRTDSGLGGCELLWVDGVEVSTPAGARE